MLIKVYKTIMTREYGKYARLCVQIIISNMLLAMFSVKGKHYKIKYEGLHLLCLAYGRYGHYAETCGTKTTNTLEKQVDKGKRMDPNKPKGQPSGPC